MGIDGFTNSDWNTSGGQPQSAGRPRAKMLRIDSARESMRTWYSMTRSWNLSLGSLLGHRFGPVEKEPQSGSSSRTSLPTMNVYQEMKKRSE